MTLRDLISTGKRGLDHAGIFNSARDARLLAAHVMGIDPTRITLHELDDIDNDVIERYGAVIQKRIDHCPVSRIIGARQFWGRIFKITADVLDPRGDSETLIAEALGDPANHVLDLGTGSGILAITLAVEWSQARIVATDISNDALDVARENAAQHKVETQIQFCQSDWFQDVQGVFDLIISNPPYIAEHELQDLERAVINYDPMIALSPGGDGLDPYRIIASQARDYLRPNGRVIVEIGHLQGRDVQSLFADAGFADARILQDLNGKDRLIVAKYPD